MAIDSIRRVKARPVTSLDAILDARDAKGGYWEKHFIEHRPDNAEAADKELEDEAERRRLDFELKRKALSLCLREEFHEWERTIFNMRKRDGQSYEVIGGEMTMKPDMVKKQYFRINAKIQRHLQEYQKLAASA